MESGTEPVVPPTERMLGLSDALFGIAITFLALDFGADPPEAAGELGGYLRGNLPDYVAYVSTFLLVGFQWWRHHELFRFVKRRTETLLLLNATLLGFVALVPFGMQALGRNGGSPVSLAVFAGLMTCIGGLLLAIWEYAVRKDLVIRGLERPLVVRMRIQLLIMPGAFLAAMLAAVFMGFLDRPHAGSWILLATIALIVSANLLVPRPAATRDVTPDATPDAEEPGTNEPVETPPRRTSLLATIRDGSRSQRLTVFTDGIFAVALTIMALRLTPPHQPLETTADLAAMYSANSAALMAYVISFYVLAQQWIRHVQLFDRDIVADTTILWLNLVLLMFVAFMPFVTELIAAPGGRTAVLLYLAILSGAMVTEILMGACAQTRQVPTTVERDPSTTRYRWMVRIAALAILALALVLAATTPTPETGLYALLLFTVIDPVCRRISPPPAAPA